MYYMKEQKVPLQKHLRIWGNMMPKSVHQFTIENLNKKFNDEYLY